ncbi:hypothetical protein [Nocardia asteroides]|uniref:hypothetical protein n=2 Tax=Nocardia asteroides TaxID=1824 RepID=UPI0036505C1F
MLLSVEEWERRVMFRARIVRGIVLAGMVSGAMSVGGVAAADDGRALAVDARVSVASPQPESMFGGLAAWLPPELRQPDRLVDLLGGLVDLGPFVEWIGPWQAPPEVGPQAGPQADAQAPPDDPGARSASGPVTAIVAVSAESDVEATPLVMPPVHATPIELGEGPPGDESIATAPSCAYDSLHHAFLGFAVAAMVIAFALVASTVLTGTVPAGGPRRRAVGHRAAWDRAPRGTRGSEPADRPAAPPPHHKLGRGPDLRSAPGRRAVPEQEVSPCCDPGDRFSTWSAAVLGWDPAGDTSSSAGPDRDPGGGKSASGRSNRDMYAHNTSQPRCRCGRNRVTVDHLVGARAGPRRSAGGIGNANAPPRPGSEPVESAPVESTVEPAIGGAAPVT